MGSLIVLKLYCCPAHLPGQDVVTDDLCKTAAFFFFLISGRCTEITARRKESFLNKKAKQLQDLTEEKGHWLERFETYEGYVRSEGKEINVLQKKVST